MHAHDNERSSDANGHFTLTQVWNEIIVMFVIGEVIVYFRVKKRKSNVKTYLKLLV